MKEKSLLIERIQVCNLSNVDKDILKKLVEDEEFDIDKSLEHFIRFLSIGKDILDLFDIDDW